MSSLAIALVLLSTLLHTAWNSALKNTEAKRCFNAWLLVWCTVWSLPGGLWALTHGRGMSGPALGAALASSLLWLFYYEGLARAYEGGDLSAMYPVMRGATPLLAAVIGLGQHQWPTPLGWLGLVTIAGAVWLIGGAPTRLAAWCQPEFAAALMVGAVGAAYSAIDSFGVRHCDAQLYLLVENGLAATWLLVWARRHHGAAIVTAFGRDSWRTMAPVAVGAWGAYILVLYAFQLAPTAYVVALRATAVLWSVLYGGLVLREPAMRQRLAYGLFMVLGVVLLKVWGSP